MKALVIDNEKHFRNALMQLLGTYCPEVESVYEAEGVESGIKAIQENHPDIVFLDVEMDDGTGMDLLSKLGEYRFQLVFVTAFNTYAIDAFRFSALDYLLKPVDPDDLMKSVAKALKNLERDHIADQLEVMRESLNNISKSDKKIVLRDNEAIHFIKVSDILRCEADGPYTRFFINDKQILVSKNLKEYEGLLKPYSFFRAHHSHLVNLKRILRFDKSDGGQLIMEDNSSVPVSVRKKEELMERIQKF